MWVFILGNFFGGFIKLYAGTIYDSKYVTFSPDGHAFTTNAGDKNYQWYDVGTSEDTGIASTIRPLREGEHYYKSAREGKIPVGKWEVVYRTGSCCHNSYPVEGDPYHGIEFGRHKCLEPYYSGWIAYCADCGEAITYSLIYMSKEAAASITQLNMGLTYYYLCPFCSNLEQGVMLDQHLCENISWNLYHVVYDSNALGIVGGFMEKSVHIYNNETTYEGELITPAIRLNKNTYSRIGYEFNGWNTKADGTGLSFADQQEVLNLTTENYDIEGKGIVTLYAQWKKSQSILCIDPNGGTYNGKNGISTFIGDYGGRMNVDSSLLKPPMGYTVTFDAQGGKAVASITGTRTFQDWKLSQPFHGKMDGDGYVFLGKEDEKDTITAVYGYDSIVLPEASKTGSSFGGWYYDQECRKLAGSAGDSITPAGNIKLYAKWVDLVLYAEDNYNANKGKGAVDLSWEQNDGNSKTYLVYQSQDNKNWVQVSGSEDISNTNKVDRSFAYSGSSRTVTIPYTGLYTLTAYGAQGASYGGFGGGRGGKVTGSVWLKKGEVVTYTIGGQNGYNGGGSAEQFGSGGGSTVVSTDLKGIVMIAGGGGGATSVAAGGAGGSNASNVTAGTTGQSGAAGGGGGYRGGTAGEVIRHYHTDSCYRVYSTAYSYYKGATDSNGEIRNNVGNPFVWYTNGEAQYNEKSGVGEMFFAADHKTAIYGSAHTKGESGGRWMYLCTSDGSYHIPVKQNTSVYIQWWKNNWSDYGGDLKLYVLDQNGDQIYYESTAGIYGGQASKGSWIAIPSGVTAVQIRLYNDWGSHENAWIYMGISEVSFYGGTQRDKICAYAADGQVISSREAYGGSSYVNTDFITDYAQEAGKKEGNGSLTMVSGQIGYMEVMNLKGVRATDLAAPGAVEDASVRKTAISDSRVVLSWQPPEDFGTDYYHKVESYLPGKSAVLSTSNVTVNTLVSGVAGYYYLVDTSEKSIPSSQNGNWSAEPDVEIILAQDRQYFHVAAMDKAGNIGPAIHIPIGRKDEEVAWPVMTDVIEVTSDKDNVYPAGAPDTYYIKCDGKIPAALSFYGYLTAEASVNYQVNHTIFDTFCEGEQRVRLDVFTPSAETITDAVLTTDASGLIKTVTGRPLLEDAAYTVTKRSESCKKLLVTQKFTAPASLDGRKVLVTPVAGVVFQGETVYSDWKKDEKNAVCLIGDGTAPEITGIELLEKLAENWNGEDPVQLTFQANDEGSGIREFYVVITNNDNAARQTFSGEGSRLRVTVDPDNVLFQGDFTARFHAVDNVGNETVTDTRTEEFSLNAWIERILEPHDPVFKGGESGILHIETTGYAEKIEVEFPQELINAYPELNQAFIYEQPSYLQEEEITFMIPLELSLGEYQVAVRAMKGTRSIERQPAFSALGKEKSVLDEIRTRLR